MSQRSLKIGLIIAVSLHAFDELVLTIGLPTIVNELGGGDWYGATLASYMLAALIGGVWAGTSTDQRGPLHIFLIGYALFAVGLLIATQAQNVYTFIIARCLQGLGGGISWAVAFAVTNIVIPTDERPRMIAWLDSAWLIPSLLAPTIGGYLIDFLDWHWIFLVQLPFIIIVTILLLPRLRPLTKKAEHQNRDKSTPGAVLDATRIASGSALLLIIIAREVDWSWLLLPLAAALLWQPLLKVMPNGFIRARAGLAAAVMLHCLMLFSFYSIDMFLPLLLIELRGLSSSITGLVFSCCAVTWIAASFLQSHLAQHWSVLRSITTGMLIVLTGQLIVFSLLNPSTPLIFVYIGWGVTGFGMGLAYNSVVTASMDFTTSGQEGATSTANGIAASLSIGLSAGLGGAIHNHSLTLGGELQHSLAAIWLLAIATGIISLWVIYKRFTPGKNCRQKISAPHSL